MNQLLEKLNLIYFNYKDFITCIIPYTGDSIWVFVEKGKFKKYLLENKLYGHHLSIPIKTKNGYRGFYIPTYGI